MYIIYYLLRYIANIVIRKCILNKINIWYIRMVPTDSMSTGWILKKNSLISQKEIFGCGSFMVSGTFTSNWTFDLNFSTWKMNSKHYQKLFSKRLLPHLPEIVACFWSYYLFAKTSIHISRSKSNWLSRCEIRIMD